MDFDELKNKAEDFAGEHSEQVEQGLDKAGEKAAEKFGHEEQVEQGVDKLKGMIPGED